MTRLQRILGALILFQLAAVVVLWSQRSRLPLLPAINWEACLIEDEVANQIRSLEQQLVTDRPESWLELAATYRTFGLFPQAEYCYRRLDRLSPRDQSYLYYWGECLDLMGQTGEASQRYEQIIRKGLTSPHGSKTTQYCWLNIAQDRLREENVPAAIEALRNAPDVPKAKFLLARILTRSQRPREALPLIEALQRESPGMLEYNQMRSWIEAELGNHEAAQEFYGRSLRSTNTMSKWDPTYAQVLQRRNGMSSQAWHEKSLALETKGSIPEALEWSRKAVQAFWAEDRVQQLAKLELMSGRPQQAVAIAEECVRRVGASAKTLDIIGVASVQLGDHVKAENVWRRAVELEATPNLYWKLAELCKLRGDSRQVQQYQALEQYQMGKAAWLTNDLQTANGHLEKAVVLGENLPQAWYYLAETRRFQGDRAGSETAYQRCLQINPDHGRALRALEHLKLLQVK